MSAPPISPPPISEFAPVSPPRNPQQTLRRRLQGRFTTLPKIALILLSVAMAGIMVWLLPAASPLEAPSHKMIAERLLLPVATLALIGAIALRHEMRWSRKLRCLRELLPLVRSGERPIDDLSQLDCQDEIGQLVPTFKELLHEVRHQRAKLAMLEEEMRQRIASRTDALERAVGTLRHQATRDALTGLSNRRSFDCTLPRVLANCRTQKMDCALLMIDIDNFKTLNDTLGHASGDQFLRDVGGIIRSTVRSTDLTFRLGGDEFVILMPDATATAADALRTRLTSLIDAHVKTIKSNPPPGMSIGLVLLSLCGPNCTPQKFLATADSLLYQDKKIRKAAERAVA